MARQSEIPLVPVTLNLFQGDREELEKFYPKNGAFGYQMVIRTLVHEHVKHLQEQASRQEVASHDKPTLSAEDLAKLGISRQDGSGVREEPELDDGTFGLYDTPSCDRD